MDNICIYVLSVGWGGETVVPSRGETLTVAPVPLETRQEYGHLLVPLFSGVIGTVRHCSVIPHFAPYGLSIRWLHHLPVKPYALVFLAARVRAVFRGGPSRPQARPSHPAWPGSPLRGTAERGWVLLAPERPAPSAASSIRWPWVTQPVVSTVMVANEGDGGEGGHTRGPRATHTQSPARCSCGWASRGPRLGAC